MSNIQKFVLLILGIIAIAGVVIFSIVRDAFVNKPDYQVSVIGRGEVNFVPDLATIRVGVTTFKFDTAVKAINDNNDKITKIVTAVKALGIKPEDIQTTNYNLQPQYDYSNNQTNITGYNATQEVVVKVRDIDKDVSKINQVLNASTTNGANQVLGIVFDSSLLEDYKEQARIKAIESAKSKADELAKATGVKMGKVIGWWENVIQSPDNPNNAYYGDVGGKGGIGGGAGATPTSADVQSGTMRVVIEMNLNYKVK